MATNNMDTSKLVFSFRPLPGLKTIHQRTIWRFHLLNEPGMVLDVIRCDEFLMSRKNEGRLNRPIESLWQVEIHRESWDALLLSNSRSDGRTGLSSSALKVEQIFNKQYSGESDNSAMESFVQVMRKVVDTFNLARVF